MWPHRTTLRAALAVAILAGVIQLAALLAAAHLDDTLRMDGPAIGLLENPGIFSIVVGDVVLIIISTVASQMTRKMGRRLPSRRPALVRRYFRSYVDRRLFGYGGIFYRILAFLILIGAMVAVNQTVQMFNSVQYYGHPTFADWGQIHSFVVVRVVVVLSWCIIVPLFTAYLLTHVIAIQMLTRAAERRDLTMFNERHPDRCGGYSFFGWLDTLYVLGILTVLLEIVLIFITHDQLTLGSVLAICAVVGVALIMSICSIGAMFFVVRRQERRLKVQAYSRNRRVPAPATLDTAILNFKLHFSPYTTTAFRLAVGLRVLIAAPAALRIVQYVNAGS